MTLRQLLGITDLVLYVAVRQNGQVIWGSDLAVKLLYNVDSGKVDFGDTEVDFISIEDSDTLYLVLEDR